MQIRIANRQDEQTIRSLVLRSYEEASEPPGQSIQLDMTGRDSDLSNIESAYFWFDGIFIVAEEEGEIVGFAAARRGPDDDLLRIHRFYVVPQPQATDVAGRALARAEIEATMFDTIKFFAGNFDYPTIVMSPDPPIPRADLSRLGLSETAGIFFLDTKA